MPSFGVEMPLFGVRMSLLCEKYLLLEGNLSLMCKVFSGDYYHLGWIIPLYRAKFLLFVCRSLSIV